MMAEMCGKKPAWKLCRQKGLSSNRAILVPVWMMPQGRSMPHKMARKSMTEKVGVSEMKSANCLKTCEANSMKRSKWCMVAEQRYKSSQVTQWHHQ